MVIVLPALDRPAGQWNYGRGRTESDDGWNVIEAIIAADVADAREKRLFAESALLVKGIK